MTSARDHIATPRPTPAREGGLNLCSLWGRRPVGGAASISAKLEKLFLPPGTEGGGGGRGAVPPVGKLLRRRAMSQEMDADRLRLEHWSVKRLVPSPRNARTHSDAQVAEIAGSIRAFGFANPILASPEGDIIAGHGRLAAALLLGLEQVPVIVLSGLTEVQRRQLLLADNRI